VHLLRVDGHDIGNPGLDLYDNLGEGGFYRIKKESISIGTDK